MALETRNRTTPAGNPIKEKYVECIGCGDWRWIQFMSQAMQCMQCRQSVSLSTKAKTTQRDLNREEKAFIKAFLKVNSPSVTIQPESKILTERTEYGVSNCSSKIPL